MKTKYPDPQRNERNYPSSNLDVASVTQTPWGGSTFKPINFACDINGS